MLMMLFISLKIFPIFKTSVWKAMDLTEHIFSEAFEKSNVIIKDKSGAKLKLEKMIQDGPKKIQMIADFDATLTKSHVNGKPTTHSIGVFNNVPTLSKEFEKGCKTLHRKYNDLAYSPEVSEEQRQEVLDLWWAGYVALLTKEYVSLEDIQKSTDIINTPLRDGCDEMFAVLSKHEVPVVVVSAGIGEVVSHSLRSFQPRVVSNFLEIDEKGKISGFKGPHISVYNKHQITLPVDPIRHNIILLGDSLGDTSMADNVPNVETVLKIGFLSNKDDNALEKYCNSYDIVLVEDQTMNVLNALLRGILAPVPTNT